ncbi:MAG: hypothetical protein ACLPN5_06425, partial [Roseiarcus sp.]
MSAPLAAARPARPYPGLRPFETDEWSIFFGRERMIDEVIARLARDRLVLVHGASGSGKSSLVRAGVLPKLARQHQRHGAPWLTCAMRPSGGPLWNLAAEFAGLEGRGDDVERIGAIVNRFDARGARLASVASGIEGLAGKSLCILVDQFEELFRFEKETSRDEAELFVDLISRAAGDEASPAVDVRVVVTMRSEFLGECARFAGLAETINRTQYLVPRMDDEAMLRAVRRPAEMYGGSVGEALAEKLVASVRGREDELPLLQHGLMLMWDAARARAAPGAKPVLDGAKVDEAGGLAALLSNHADTVMAAAAPDERRRKIVESVFRELTDVNAEGSAIRRPRAFADLCAVAGASADELRTILDAFRAPGVTFLTPYAGGLAEATLIDISHEALIRCWRRIAAADGWLRREFDDGLAWRSLLTEARAFGHDSSRVLSPAATEDRGALMAERNEPWSRRYGGGWEQVGALIAASRKAAASARRRRRMAFASLAGLTFGALLLAGAAVWEWRQANEETEQAQAQTARAEAEATKDRQAREALAMVFSHVENLEQKKTSSASPEQDLFNKVLAAAGSGNPVAEGMVGLLYWEGLGTAQDFTKAREWSEKGAAARDAMSMGNLGILYDGGHGVPQDYATAREWYERGAAAGDATSMLNLGFLYDMGRGVAQDYVKAREWYEKGAAAGDATSMGNLGRLYENGKGVAQDYAKAREWSEKGAAAGDPTSMRNLGWLYDNGKGVAQDYAKAREWSEKGAAAGDPTSMRNLGWLYDNGKGVA